ncbi:MAG: hypothetical protein IK120_02675 [Muribaculaceae bacterium]|nr:hypothetical protein [Muribaculaceae bacterium]
MKKTLLSIAIMAVAAGVMSAADVIVENRSFADEKLPEPHVYVASEMTPAAQQPAVATRAISSVEEVCGNYLMWFQPKSTGTVPKYSGVKIKKINAQKVSIEGFWSSLCNPITATVDFANSKLLIAPQVILTDDTYGDCDIASWVEKWYGLAIYRDKNIEVAINGNTLTFISNWGIFINSGSQADKYFEMSDNTVLTRANAEMELLGKNAVAPTTVVVDVVQNDRNIAITNFGGFGQTVTATAYNDDTVYIPQQVAYSYYNGTEVIDYQTWLVNPETNTLTGKIINNGKMTKEKLTFGPWGVFYKNDSGSYSGYMFVSSTIRFTDGSTFDCMLGVDEVKVDKEVASTKYVNISGQESSRPFDGINVRVTTFTDGTTKAEKVFVR